MPDQTPDFDAYLFERRALYRLVKDAVHLLNAILDVPIDHPIPFLLRERAAALVDGIRTLTRPNQQNGERKRDARPSA
jgi:hypothetical protein